MGVETAILTGLSAAASHKASRDKRKADNQAQQQQQKLLDQQLADKTKEIEDERKARSAALRARYAAANLRTGSRSAQGLLQALNKRSDDELTSLKTTRSLRKPNLLEDDSFGNAVGLLRNLQSLNR